MKNMAMYIGRFRLIVYVVILSSLVGTFAAYAQQPASLLTLATGAGTVVTGTATAGTATATAIDQQLCNIIVNVADVIGFIALFMFIVGGVLYAFAHFLPAAGNIKGSLQGWGMGILMGGIVMLVLYLLAPTIVTTIINFGTTGGHVPLINTPTC